MYVTNSYVNQTISLPAPVQGTKDCRYGASKTKLVHYTPNTGKLSWMDFEWLANKSPNPGAQWITSSVSEDLGKATSNAGPTVGSSKSQGFEHGPLNLLLLLLMLFKLL